MRDLYQQQYSFIQLGWEIDRVQTRSVVSVTGGIHTMRHCKQQLHPMLRIVGSFCLPSFIEEIEPRLVS